MPVPVVNIVQMREWEKATWATGQTEAGVIRHVGNEIARLAMRLTRPDDAVLILAGKGHNGDDARAAKEFLSARKIILLDVSDPQTALAEFRRRTGVAPVSLQKEIPAQAEPEDGDRLEACPTLIIDGLFGIGLSRPLDNGWKKVIAEVNKSKIPVLAVDVPSGLNADTGQPQGAAIEAVVTLTVGAPKIGMLQQSAWPFVGRLEVAEDVGLIPCPHQGELNWTLPGDFAGFPPRRGVAGHKGSYGHLAIIAGSFGFHGAAVLAARAAQRAQPGLITLFTQENIYRPVAEQLQAVMVNVWKPETQLPESTSAVLIGPGLAAPGMPEAMKTPTRKLWRDSELPVIVDASALAWLEPNAAPK
ncbi:MAG TPA: NAD(P)H-hydrate epimerase, partial [Verrucomicrobiae bacterium]|nr:NAD(P)H-hydrate epimerase [Verrucomicrobiae bacterium]